MAGGPKIGGFPRGVCAVCGEDVALRGGGLPVLHGPYENRCPGSDLQAEDLPQSTWDTAAGRPRGWSCVDERVANGALVANTAAGNFTNASRRGTR